jgi:hypothetical protein
LKSIIEDHEKVVASERASTVSVNEESETPRDPPYSGSTNASKKETTHTHAIDDSPAKQREFSKSAHLISEEDRQRGTIQLSVFVNYFKYGHGWLAFLLVVLSIILATVALTMQSLWVTWWAQNKFSDWTVEQYLNGYIIVSICTFTITLFQFAIVSWNNFMTARRLHEGAVAGLMRAPVSFFEANPIGRIVNRLMGDVMQVDMQLYMAALNVAYMVGEIISSFIILSLGTPLIIRKYFIPQTYLLRFDGLCGADAIKCFLLDFKLKLSFYS